MHTHVSRLLSSYPLQSLLAADHNPWEIRIGIQWQPIFIQYPWTWYKPNRLPITFLRLCSWHLTDSTTYVCPDENCQNKSEQMQEQLWWGCVLCGLGLCRGDMLPTSSWLRLAFLKKTWKVETCTTGCEPQPHEGVEALWLVSRAPLFGHRTCSTVTVTPGETEVLTDWTCGHHLWHFLNENPHLCQLLCFLSFSAKKYG